MLAYYEYDGTSYVGNREEIINDEQKIHISLNHLEQIGAMCPFNDFTIGLSCSVTENDERIIDIDINIYNMNNKKIESWEMRYYSIDNNNGSISKYYNYSLFFPRKIKEIIEIKYYYEDIYYEYKREFILTGKRNVSSWDAVMGI